MFYNQKTDNITMKILNNAKKFFTEKGSRALAKRTLSLMLLAFFLCCVKLCAEDSSPAEAQVMREKFVTEAKKYVGCPYVYGAIGPDKFDCSGLVYYVARESIQKQMPRTAKAIYNYCRIVPDKEKEVGDLLFFKTNDSAPITHVGIYIGNNQFISAISDGPNTGVIISSLKQDYWKPKYVACGQFLKSGKSKTSSDDSDDLFDSEDETESDGSSTVVKGSSFFNQKAEGLSAITADAALFCNWSLLAPNSFMFQWRGIDLMTNIRYSKWILEPGLGLGLRFNYGLGVFQMPIVISATINDYFRFYAGPVITFGNPHMMVTGEEIKASGFPGILGISISTPSFAVAKSKVQIVQDISYTIFNQQDNSALPFTKSIAAGLILSTGVRVTLNAGSLFNK